MALPNDYSKDADASDVDLAQVWHESRLLQVLAQARPAKSLR